MLHTCEALFPASSACGLSLLAAALSCWCCFVYLFLVVGGLSLGFAMLRRACPKGVSRGLLTTVLILKWSSVVSRSIQGNSMPPQELLTVPAPLPESSGLTLTHEL